MLIKIELIYIHDLSKIDSGYAYYLDEVITINLQCKLIFK